MTGLFNIHDNIDDVKAGLREFERRELPLAIALMLNDVAEFVPKAFVGEIGLKFDRPTSFVLNSMFVDRGWPGAEIRNFYDYTEPLALAGFSNQPFKECNHQDGRGKFIRHALETQAMEYLAIVPPPSWHAPAGHARLWAEHTSSRAYEITWRVDFTGDGALPVSHGIFVWDKKDPAPAARILRLARGTDPGQPGLFGGVA